MLMEYSTQCEKQAQQAQSQKKIVRKESRAYEKKLQEELNSKTVKRMERNRFPPEKFEKEEYKEIKESTTDPESATT